MSPEARPQRLYRRLLRLYPAAFRERFGDELVQLFGDQVRDASSRGTGTYLRLWLRTSWDLAVTAPREHRQVRTLAHSLSTPPSLMTKGLGLTGIVGGALLLAAWWAPFLPWDHDTFNLRLIVFNVGAIAIAVAVHRRQASLSRWLSTASVTAVVLANAWYLVMILLGHGRPVFPEPDPEFRRIFFYAAIAMWASDAVFGAVTLRFGAVTRIGAASLAIGSVLAGSFLGLGGPNSPIADLIEPLSLVGIFLVGVGWIWLGVDVATRRRPIASPTR